MAALLVGTMAYSIYRVNAQSSTIAEDNLLKQVQSSVQYNTQVIISNSLAQYEKEKGIVPDDVLLTKILDNIRNTKYSESGYYFVYNYDGIRLVAPENKAQEGQNLYDLTDQAGGKPVQQFIKQSKAGGGFVSYMWLNPKTNAVEEKVSYTAPLKIGNTEVVVGTGTYLSMLEETNAQMQAGLSQIVTALLWILIPGILVITGLLIFFTYLYYSKKIIKPIREVAVAAAKLAEGDTNVALNIRSYDEVGMLASTIDGEVRQAFMDIRQTQAVAEKRSRYESEQVSKLVVNLERLSRGELYCDMNVEEPDADTAEIHQTFTHISESLYSTVRTLQTYVGEISSVLTKMAEGNLSVSIDSEYMGDFKKLRESINSIVESLNGVLSDINASAEQVASGTRQVSEGSQTISQGAAEQASSIEELTASISQIASQTKQNASNANRANELAMAAKKDAVHGNDKMKDLQRAMVEINESSENISKIIKVIDDIAFQTNILALNAAVEAARAGVHGKGFAVVAEEVRNLAAKSANAAKETTALIEGSIQKTEAGTKIADETAKALTGIVDGVEKAVSLVGEIAVASNEQATGIAQVNKGVEQMSQVVQTNSATSEEAAAASEQLSSQAELLKQMVDQFTLKSTGKRTATVVDMEQRAARGKQQTSSYSDRIVLNDSDFGKY